MRRKGIFKINLIRLSFIYHRHKFWKQLLSLTVSLYSLHMSDQFTHCLYSYSANLPDLGKVTHPIFKMSKKANYHLWLHKWSSFLVHKVSVAEMCSGYYFPHCYTFSSNLAHPRMSFHLAVSSFRFLMYICNSFQCYSTFCLTVAA